MRQSSSDQNIFYDATVAIRRTSADLAADVVRQLAELLPTPRRRNPDQAPTPGGEGDNLNLVDTAEFESSLALGRMVNRGEDMYKGVAGSAVDTLLDAIGRGPYLVRLPIHVRPLSKAFQKTVASQHYPAPVLLKIFEYFTREFLRDLKSYYLQLNRGLAAQGLRPELEQEIAAKGNPVAPHCPRPIIRKSPARAPGHLKPRPIRAQHPRAAHAG